MEKYNEICYNMASNHPATQVEIRQIMHDRNDYSDHYIQFCREMCKMMNGDNGVTWFRGRGRGNGRGPVRGRYKTSLWT